jgi:hypothetical protein
MGLTTLPCKKLLRSLQEIQPFLMEEDCGGGQGLSWAVEPRRTRRRRFFCFACGRENCGCLKKD